MAAMSSPVFGEQRQVAFVIGMIGMTRLVEPCTGLHIPESGRRLRDVSERIMGYVKAR